MGPVSKGMMKTVERLPHPVFVLAIAFLVLTACGGVRENVAPGKDAPPLSGELFQGMEWGEAARGHDSTVFKGRNKDVILKVTAFNDIGEEQASNYISSKLFVINSLYREINSPYPGQLSNRIECAEEFKPATVENSPFDYYLIYATGRFTYGACSWDLIAYRIILYFLHCEEENTLYQIELFVPVDDYAADHENSLKTLDCPS